MAKELQIPTELLQLLTPEQAWHYHMIPMKAANGSISMGVDESQNYKGLEDELEMLLGMEISFQEFTADQISTALGKYYRRTNGTAKVTDHISEDFLIRIIREAKELEASDIHIESYDERCRIRFRIDGMLIERYIIDKNEYPALINKVKIKANLDIAEKRLPQDGRIYFKTEDAAFDIRVSILPAIYGEKIVMRLLSNDATNIDLDSLGFSPTDLQHYMEGVQKPHGIVLISGPTGSGKTTTLYATLKLLNEETKNILTIEDPVEYTLEGINQAQVKESIGLTFAKALRTFLRQDPDIIMLGEIRDQETASMAIRASLTGHLVLTTVHTNSAWGSVSRLIDMGVPSYLLASTLNTTVAQRLLRLLCPHCKKGEKLNDKLPVGFIPLQKVIRKYTAVGCDHCYFTGYKGRSAVYEIIPIDHGLAVSIRNNEFNIKEKLKEYHIRSLAENAWSLFEQGLTSYEEVYPILVST
ncbi:MAG: type II/IV secretion system protein [Bacteroidetes bacterium]|nr:type II/IV secretion system protein [Bacteroidota bacterium]